MCDHAGCMNYIYMRDFRQKTSRARGGEGTLPLRTQGSFVHFFPKTTPTKLFFFQKMRRQRFRV